MVDLDATLTPTDTLLELVILLVKRNPLDLLRLPFWLLRGRAAFKEFVSTRASIPVDNLPFRADVVEYLRGERESGRRIVLATAAHHSVAKAVAARIGIFDGVIASDATTNMKGSRKLSEISERIGSNFVYVGDSSADLPIWQAARAAVLVGASPRVASAVRRVKPVIREFPRERASVRTWMRALRMHQWLKNLLVFVPLLTSYSFLDLGMVAVDVVAFIALSLTASATYIANDIYDLDSDREHLRKRHRALASGRISLTTAIAVATALLALAILLGSFVSLGFLSVLMVYLVFTTGYSLILKQHVMIDVVMLSLLYTIRIIAGSVAVQVETSAWLLAFSVFIFFSLALVKRCAELVDLERHGRSRSRGRDYFVGDLVILWPLGVGAALCSIVVFGLFITTQQTHEVYESPQLLWPVAVGLLYWLSRLWIKTARGQMHDDPLIYAVRDRGSIALLVAMTLTMIAAHFLNMS